MKTANLPILTFVTQTARQSPHPSVTMEFSKSDSSATMVVQTETGARISAPHSLASAAMGKGDKCQFARSIAGTVGMSPIVANNVMTETRTTETDVITFAILSLVGSALTLVSIS